MNFEFTPYFERLRNGRVIRYPGKVMACFVLGAFYILLLRQTVPDKVFYLEKAWLLGAILSAAMFTLYIAVGTFRNMCKRLLLLPDFQFDIQPSVERHLSDLRFISYGLGFAVVNTLLGYTFGISSHAHLDTQGQIILYLGFLLTGFICGMPIAGIVGLVSVINGFSTALKQIISYKKPDGCGGTEFIGNALLVFGLVTLAVGVLISLFLAGFNWDRKTDTWVNLALRCWIFFPYFMAFIVISVPTVAVSYQLMEYKRKHLSQVHQDIVDIENKIEPLRDCEHSQLLESELKKLEKKQDSLYQMSIIPFGNRVLFNSVIALVPNVLGTISALSSLLDKKPPS